jgi:hypothetical protein
LIDELTNKSVQGLETDENELTNGSVQIQRNELINRAVKFKADANAIKDELTHISVHLNSDKRGKNELTHRSVCLSSDNRDVDELTNKSVHLTQSRK